MCQKVDKIAMSNMEDKEKRKASVQNKKIVGYISAVVSMLLLATSIATSQFLAGAVPVFQLNLWRFLFQAVGALVLRISSCCDIRIPRGKWLLFCAVLVSHLGFNITFFTASIFLPAGNIGAYAGAALIIFNVFLSACIKSERVWHLYVSAALCIVGIVLLAQPEFIFPTGLLSKAPHPNWTSPCFDDLHTADFGLVNSSTREIFQVRSETDSWIGYILVIVSGICISTSFLSMKRFVRTENPFILAFWLGFFGCALSVVPMVTLESIVLPSGTLCILVLILHGISSTQTVLLSPFCLQFLSQAQYSFIVTLHMAVLLVLQYSVLSDVQPGNGNWVEVLGGAVCIGACLLGPTTDMMQHRQRQRSKSQEAITDHGKPESPEKISTI